MNAAQTDSPRSDEPARDLKAPSSSSWAETAEEARTIRKFLPYATVISVGLGGMVFVSMVRIALGQDAFGPEASWQYYTDSWQWDLVFGLLGVGVLAALSGIFCWNREHRNWAKSFVVLSTMAIIACGCLIGIGTG